MNYIRMPNGVMRVYTPTEIDNKEQAILDTIGYVDISDVGDTLTGAIENLHDRIGTNDLSALGDNITDIIGKMYNALLDRHATLTPDDWEWDDIYEAYKKSVTVSGIESTSKPVIGQEYISDLPNDDELLNFSYIKGWKCSHNTITFYCTNVPDINLNLIIKCSGAIATSVSSISTGGSGGGGESGGGGSSADMSDYLPLAGGTMTGTLTTPAPVFLRNISLGRKSGTTKGTNSVALGNNVTASGNNSTALGDTTTATGAASFAIGTGSNARGSNQSVIGKYNVNDTNNTYAMIIGNGANNSSRSNAFTVDWDGNVISAGDVSANGVSLSSINTLIGSTAIASINPTITGALVALNNSITSVNTSLTNSINTTNNNVSNINTKIGNTNISDIGNSITAAISNLNADIEANTSNISNINTSISALQTVDTNFASAIDTINGTIGNTQINESTITGAINALEVAMADVQATQESDLYVPVTGGSMGGKLTIKAALENGENTSATGDYSHAEGLGTIAASDYQHVSGKYNIRDANNTYLAIVGNGTSASSRSNAYTLDKNGNAKYAGDVTATINGSTVSISQLLKSSDIAAWAKASTKPTYTNTEVGAAAAMHTHNYAGSATAGGAATTANNIPVNPSDTSNINIWITT